MENETKKIGNLYKIELENFEKIKMENAVKYYKDNLQGTIVKNKNLAEIDPNSKGRIKLTNSGIKKLQSSDKEKNKLPLIEHLPELLKTAVNVRKAESTKEKHNRESFIYMNNELKTGEETLKLHITLIKRNNKEIQFYNYNFINETWSK